MRKLLLIIALTLLWSFSANAQMLKQDEKGNVVLPSSGAKKVEMNDNCRTHYTAPEAYKSTADGNVNTFSATYSSVTQRTCEDKNDKPIEHADPWGGCGPNYMYCQR